MRNLSDTISRLAAQRRSLPHGVGGTSDLSPLDDFGSNPGQLKAWVHRPAGLKPNAPLVVVLHGCTQTAAGYDQGSGWSTLADRYGFVVLYPEQQRSNNANLCFNWFVPDDIKRASGEALSIRQMVERLVADDAIDPARIFVTGLSAGGAMTSVMLATYPDVFAGGAVIAGLPFGSATTMPEAFDRMRGHGGPTSEALAALVRKASGHKGAWPTLSVWHGSADRTVAPSNMETLVDQWRGLQGLPAAPTRTESIGTHNRRVWCDADGKERIEAFSIAAMGHGTPIDPAVEDGCGTPAPYILSAGISSTQRIAQFWGIAETAAEASKAAQRPSAAGAPAAGKAIPAPRPTKLPAPTIVPPSAGPKPAAVLNGVAKVIDDALRAAGLVR